MLNPIIQYLGNLMSRYHGYHCYCKILLPRIEAFSILQARMDPAAGSKRKLNPSSPEAGVMLSIFVKDILWW